MSDLTPITREEALLDGVDLEPITRKEQFIKRIYDKTQEVPTPITREEWFLNKAGEGGGEVTVEQLNATENGTYSEPGKAYSPVIVEVPEPTLITKSITANGTYSASADNADGYSSVTVAVDGFKKKSIANTPTDIASFNDGTANPMPSLEISIEPVQSGSGDPSPSNVRPISGWDKAQITVTDDLTTPTETHTLSIPFHDNSDNPITVYGGTLNVTSGELRVDRTMVTFNGSETWYLQSINSYGIANFNIDLDHYPAANFKSLCNMLLPQKSSINSTETEGYFVHQSGSSVFIRIFSSRASTVEEFKTWLASKPIQLVYALTTPQTYQLTPTQVSTLLGQNNIFADCGQVLEGEYFVTL